MPSSRRNSRSSNCPLGEVPFSIFHSKRGGLPSSSSSSLFPSSFFFKPSLVSHQERKRGGFVLIGARTPGPHTQTTAAPPANTHTHGGTHTHRAVQCIIFSYSFLSGKNEIKKRKEKEMEIGKKERKKRPTHKGDGGALTFKRTRRMSLCLKWHSTRTKEKK